MPISSYDDASAVKSRLLPLAASEAALERWIERLPRTALPNRLQPLNGIATIDRVAGHYESTCDTPVFVVQFEAGKLQRGWYYIESTLVRSNGSRRGEIHALGPDGVSRLFSWPITSNLRGSVREVVWLPSAVDELRWSPMCEVGPFEQGPLLIHRIGPAEARLRRLHRVYLFRHRFKSSKYMPLALWMATHLDSAYLQTAEFRTRRAISIAYGAYLDRLNGSLGKRHAKFRRDTRQAGAGMMISIVMPVGACNQALLRRSLDAVRAQWHEAWELIVVIRAGTAERLASSVRSWVQHDPRVSLLTSMTAINDEDAFNEGLAHCRGTFVLRLDPCDVVQPEALHVIASCETKRPGATAIYGDEDHIDPANGRSDPCFKPDWNLDLLLSMDYIGSAIAWQRELLVALGGHRAAFGPAARYDLMLRAIARVSQPDVRHIHQVIYSRAPLAPSALKISSEAALHALQSHLKPQGARADAGLGAALHRVHHPLPSAPPHVTVIIPTRDRATILRKCVDSIKELTTYPNWDILIVDNQSREQATLDYLESLTSQAGIAVIPHDGPFNYSAINNAAVKQASGSVLCLLNNDIEVIAPDWLDEMVSHALRPEVGAVGAKLLYPRGLVQHAGVVLGMGGVAGHVHRYLPGNAPGYCSRAIVVQSFSAVTGACLVVRKSLYEMVGGLNEVHLAVAFNDVDFCLKLRRAGYRNVFTPHALLYHHESLSRGRDDTPAKHATFVREYDYMRSTWADELTKDPAYNRNLSLEGEDFLLHHE